MQRVVQRCPCSAALKLLAHLVIALQVSGICLDELRKENSVVGHQCQDKALAAALTSSGGQSLTLTGLKAAILGPVGEGRGRDKGRGRMALPQPCRTSELWRREHERARGTLCVAVYVCYYCSCIRKFLLATSKEVVAIDPSLALSGSSPW